MNTLTAIIWDASKEIFSLDLPVLGSITLRWYGLLFASGFLIGQWIMTRIFRLEQKSLKDIDTLTFYMVAATVIGARLGHCLFYQPDYYLANPIKILYIWEGGLASHGAAFGIIFSIWLYSRNRAGQSFFWVIDRIVIVVALGGCLIRMGNLMNAEIVGKPTDVPWAFSFVNPVHEGLEEEYGAYLYVESIKAAAPVTYQDGMPVHPVRVLVKFKDPDVDPQQAQLFLQTQVLRSLSGKYYQENVLLPELEPSQIVIEAPSEGGKAFSISLLAIPRHPAQLYEALSCLLLFFFLLWLYSRQQERTPEGSLFSIFLIVCFGLRFFYEMLKENQVEFEEQLTLNMGQILSIPLTIGGVILLIYFLRAHRNRQTSGTDKM